MKKAKLMVVDDEKDVCDYATSFFSERGFETFSAQMGEEALKIIEKEKPDLILLDIRMEGMGGLEVLRRAKETFPDITVIMVTGVDDEDMMRDAKRLGAANYITKPLLLDELERVVLEHRKILKEKKK